MKRVLLITHEKAGRVPAEPHGRRLPSTGRLILPDFKLIPLLLGLALAGCSHPGMQTRTTGGPPDRVALIREERLPNVKLTTHDGRQVHFYDDLVQGKVVAINFMYASCRGVCAPTTANLVEVQKSLGERAGREVFFYSISLDPEDTPEVLREYAQAHKVRPGWYFLTGKKKDIELLRRKLGLYDRDGALDADRTQHSALLMLGNEPKGRWNAIPAQANPVRIRQAIERTLLPPSQWRTGQAAVTEVPFEKSAKSQLLVEPVDASKLRQYLR